MFKSVISGLKKTTQTFVSNLSSVFGQSSQQSKEQILSNLENALYRSDVGVNTTKHLVGEVSSKLSAEAMSNTADMPDHLRLLLRQEMLKLFEHPMQRQAAVLRHLGSKITPTVLMVVGVNGVGKTTTIGKIGHLYKYKYNRRIVVAAADTTRAAAVDQLQVWGQRNQIPVITRSSDQSAEHKKANLAVAKAIRQVHERVAPDMVVHDAYQYIIHQHKADVSNAPNLLIVDTAGRLQTNTSSMDELQKIYGACAKARRGAPDHVWLVLDATIGQNSIDQAKEFSKRVRVNGIIMTKLDGSARGGVILGIAHNLKIPILYLGVGEKSEDLKEFEPESFVDSILKKSSHDDDESVSERGQQSDEKIEI